MGKYDTKRVQLHLIKTYKESFDEDKENFRNNSYNAFFNSYLNNSSDPYIRSYANKLKKIYQELEKGYENIDSWWKDFNSSIEGVENKLANNANSFTISDSNLIRMTNSLPVLENYDVSFAGLISVADANNTIINSNSKNDINLSSGINSSNLKNGIFNQNKNNDGITMAFNKMAGAASIASGVNFATAFDNAFKTENKSTDDNKKSKTASVGGVGVAAMSMAMGSVKTNNGVNESSTTTTKSSGKNMGYTSNDQEKNKTESQETEQTQREEITKENGYKNDHSYKNNRKEDVLKQNNDNVFVKVGENTSAFVTVWKNVGAGINIIKNDINNKNFEGTKSSLKLVYANALASGVSTWNNIKTAAENVRKGTKEVIDNSIETAKIMAEKAEAKVSNLWNDTKKSFDENWNNLKDTLSFSKNEKRNVEDYRSYLDDKQYAQLEEQDKIWYESLEQDRNVLDGLNKELSDLQYEYASAISMKNIQTPEEYKMDYESILFEEYMAFPDQYSEELKALELKREQAVKEYTDYFNYMLSTETRFKNIDEYNAAVKELKGKISNLNLSIHNKQQIYNMLPYMFIENSNEFEKSDIKLPYNYKISNEAFEKMVSTINSNVTSDIAVDTVNEGLKKTLADYGFASQSEFNEFRNTYLMTEEERKLYFYLKLENSGEAQKYLDVMQDTINQRKGLIEASKFLEKLKDEDDIGSKLTNFFLTFEEGTSDGIDNFYNGLDRALLGVDDTYSVSEYKNMIIISALMNDPSFKEYFENFDYDSISDKVKNKDDYDKYLQYTYQFSNSFGNMLPSMLTSIAVSAIATPAAGSAVSSTLLGVSAGGNNAEQAYKSGASLGDAYLYGVLSGISEGGMEYFLGTLTPFAKNAGGEVAKPFLMNFMRETIQEGGEEALQECVDSFLKYSILGEEISAEELGSAAFQSFVFGAAMKVFMDGSSAAIKVAGKTIAITPELLNLAKNGTPEEITAYVNNQSEIVENNNIAQSPKENVETDSIPNIKTEDVQSEKITYKFNPEEKYSLKNKEWMSDYFDELAADYDDMGFISNKTGAQLEKLFLNEDYIIGIHRCGVANGTDIMNSGLNLTGHSSSGVESTNVDLSSNISFFEQNATNFLHFIRGLKTASYYKSRNSNADALIVAIPKSEFESYDILDSRFIPKENNNLFDNLGSMSRLKSEYILGSINSDNGNLGDIKFNEKFNNQEFINQMKNNNSLIENMDATINGRKIDIYEGVNTILKNKIKLSKSLIGTVLSFPGTFGRCLYKNVKTNTNVINSCLNNGLYHITSEANISKILESGYIKASNRFTSYSMIKKAFFFGTSPTVENVALNLNDIPPKLTALKIIPTEHDLLSGNMKYRLHDYVVTYDGNFSLNGKQVEKVYLCLSEENGKLLYKEVNQQAYNEFDLKISNSKLKALLMSYNFLYDSFLDKSKLNDIRNMGEFKYNQETLATKLNSSIGEISTVLSKLITDISIKTENLAAATKAKVEKINSKISLKYKSDYYIKQEVYTKFNDYLSKLGIEVAPSQFDNMINDITFIKEKDWNQFLIDKGYQTNLSGYCDSNGKIFLPMKKIFEDTLDNLILHKLTTRVRSDSNFYGYYSGFQFLGYQFINGKWETGKLMCNQFNEATTQWINRKLNPASKSTYDNNVQILDKLIEGNVLNEQELINSYFAIDSGYLYKRFRELGIIDFADFANLIDQAYVKEQVNGHSSFDQLYSIVSDLCFKASKESSTVAKTQLGVNNINEKLVNVTFDDGQFYVRANFEATMRNVPYNTIYEILYDDNTYARFLDYENNREYFNYISKGELALAIKYFERMNVVDESVTARANYIYDTVIKSNRLDKLHCVVNGAFNFIKSNINYTMSIDTINNIIFNDEMYLDYLNNIDNLSTAQRYMSLLTFKEIYKNFLLDNVFIDSKYETRLKHLSNLCEQMYNYADTELLKYSEFGANQNSVRSLALNPLKNMKTYQSMTNIVKKYFPNMNQFEINKLLRLTDTRGICSYATEANEIFMLYAGREVDFKRDYGYDMYRFESGQRVLNDELLLTDLFCSANRSNEKILEKRTFGYKFATDDGGQIPMSVGVFDNTSLSKNIDQINNFFAEKGINMVCQSKILYADATGKAFNSKFLVDFIKDGLMAGNAYELDLFSVDGKPMDLTFYGMDSSTGNYKIAGSHSFGHSVSIAGFTSDGNVIVPSWEKRLFLKWSEIQKCRIVINETKYRRVQ